MPTITIKIHIDEAQVHGAAQAATVPGAGQPLHASTSAGDQSSVNVQRTAETKNTDAAAAEAAYAAAVKKAFVGKRSAKYLLEGFGANEDTLDETAERLQSEMEARFRAAYDAGFSDSCASLDADHAYLAMIFGVEDHIRATARPGFIAGVKGT